MNKKLKIYFRNFSPIGSKCLKSFYLAVQCQLTKNVYKSPIVHGGHPIFPIQLEYFWTIDMYEKQDKLICKLIYFDANSKIMTELSQVNLDKQIQTNEENQVIFYDKFIKIGVLSYSIHSELQTINRDSTNIFNLLDQESLINQNYKLKEKPKYSNQQSHQCQQNIDDDFENQRYNVGKTPFQSINSSVIKFESYSNHSHSNILGNIDESFIEQRQPFSSNEAFLINQSFELDITNKLSSLQLWLKKLHKIQGIKNRNTNKSIELDCIVPEKYLQHNENNNMKLNIINIQLNQIRGKSVVIKSLCLNIIDQNQKSIKPLFECSFSLSNNHGQKIAHHVKQIKFKNLLAEITHDKSFVVQLVIKQSEFGDKSQEISGILIKDKFLTSDSIPLFCQDGNIFAELKYKAKMIQNASVQCLPPLQQNPLESQTQNELASNISSSPERNSSLKNKIRQRKLNNKFLKKQINNDFKVKKYSYDQQCKQTNQYSLESPTRRQIQNKNIDISKISINQHSQFSSSNQFQRSNTQELPYFRLNTDNNEYKSTRSRDNNENSPQFFRNNIKTKVNIGSSISKSSSNHKKQQNVALRSTNLTDLRQEQSEEDSGKVKGDTFNILQQNSSSIQMDRNSYLQNNQNSHNRAQNKSGSIRTDQKKKMFDSIQNLNDFVIEINSMTVILYQHPRSEEQESGKFMILKSDQGGQTFITQTLFTDHVNLNWKNKFYQFVSSDVEISMYERTGHSSQCQNAFIGKSVIKFNDLVKSIKQNFYRQEIYFKGNPIGTIIVLYDIFMKSHTLKNQRKESFSEMTIKDTIKKRTRSINRAQTLKNNTIREQEKYSIKPGSPLKNRKRAKTLQSNKSFILPSLDRYGSQSRRLKLFEGGKNIKIGRVERFLNSNMAETIGQM